MLNRAIWVLGIAVLAMLSPRAGGASTNLVFLMADDLGWNDVGYHGSEILTPNVDRLAKAGVELDRYYATPLCSPTRAALLTGRSPLRMGLDRPVELRNGLPTDERLLPEMLRKAGYQTAIAGKWHLGLEHVRYHPHNRGFDSAYGHLGPGIDYFTHIWDGGLDWHRDGRVVEEKGYTTRLIAREAARAIHERDQARPIFLLVAFNAPHVPLQAPAETMEKYASIEDPARRAYAAMVDEMDQAVGRILTALDEEGISQNTLVVWCSDNGGAPRFGADNAPFRGGKGGVLEGGIRVPAVIYQPGVVEGGRTLSQMVTAHDWLPTFAAALGFELDGTKPLDGINMWPAIQNGQSVDRTEPVIVGVFSNVAVFDRGWKYVENTGRPDGFEKALYHLDEDPTEQHDLAAEHPEKLRELAARLHGFPRAPTVAVDVIDPAAGRNRPGPGAAKKAGGRRGGGPPGSGSGVDGWKEITKPPWVEAAKKD